MTHSDSQLMSIFADALACDSPESQAAHLDRKCGSDTALRAEIEALLKAHDEAGDFLKESELPVALASNSDEAGRECAGTIIGPYKLLEQIGEGGMGVVYMADQQTPVRRRVAVKIIKPGMDTHQVIGRFEAERQALAMMDHANIAKIHDAGATENGRPYFVMELVQGVPITEYCDHCNLNTRERLELFVSVCQTVQHAHQKGVIHRDIKPTNVLVTMHDGQPAPKIIDFGVAKAIGQRLTEHTLATGFAQMIGTPLYMSPEQAELSPLGVDTRSDIYSLGVLLYELLTGTTPFDKERLHAAPYDEMRRIIREEEPPRPSARISTLAADLATTVAEHHRTDPRRLVQTVRGELDWIVMKCLEKDRNRRYETANSLADDIKNYLRDEPVQACPPTRMYRVKKFLRRHKVGVFAASAIAVAMLSGLALAAIGFVQARHQAAVASRITEYMQRTLAAADPGGNTKGPHYEVRELLDDYADKLDTELAEEPEVAATMHATIGRAYHSLGQHDKAIRHLARALELRRALFGEQHEIYADSLVDYALAVGWVQGEAEVRQALTVYRARGIEGQRIVHALCVLEMALTGQGKKLDIEQVADEAFAESLKSPGVEPWEVQSIKRDVVGAKIAKDDFVGAERMARECVTDCTRLYGADHIQTALAHQSLSEALCAEKKFKESFEAAKRSFTTMRKLLSPRNRWMESPRRQIAISLLGASRSHMLSQVISSADELAELELLFRENLSKRTPDWNDVFDPAVVAARGLISFPDFYRELGNELSAAGKTEAAKVSHSKGSALLVSLETEFAKDPEMLAMLFAKRIVSSMRDGNKEQIQPLCRELLAMSPSKGQAYSDVSSQLSTWPDPQLRNIDLAIEMANKAIELSPEYNGSWQALGWAHYQKGNWQASIDALEKSCKLQDNGDGDAFQWFFLAMAHWQLGHKAEAHKWYARAAAVRTGFGDSWSRFRAEAAELLGLADPTEPLDSQQTAIPAAASK